MEPLQNSILSDVDDWLGTVPAVHDRLRGNVGSHADGPPPSGLVTEGTVRRSTVLGGPSSLTIWLTADRNRPVREDTLVFGCALMVCRAVSPHRVGTLA